MQVYLLEHTRVTLQKSTANQNFHIFYWILEGLLQSSSYEISDFYLSADKNYKIIGENSITPSSSLKIEEKFQNLMTALEVIGFKDSDVQEIFKILAAIILIGNYLINYTVNNVII